MMYDNEFVTDDKVLLYKTIDFDKYLVYNFAYLYIPSSRP